VAVRARNIVVVGVVRVEGKNEHYSLKSDTFGTVQGHCTFFVQVTGIKLERKSD
jgi:hypothetical protein